MNPMQEMTDTTPGLPFFAGINRADSRQEDEGKGRLSLDAKIISMLDKYTTIYFEDNCFIDTGSYDGRSRILSLASQEFGDWAATRFYETYGKSLSERALANALKLIRQKARSKGHNIPIYHRFARFNDSFCVDMGGRSSNVIEVSAEGWDVIDRKDLHFVRYRQTGEIPHPCGGGNPLDLFEFINVSEEMDQTSILSWVTASLMIDIQRPILIFSGLPGTGKTVAGRIVRSLFDPSNPTELDPPRKEEEFALAFYRNPVPFFDNVSSLGAGISDMFCKAVTGGAFTKRMLYTDLDQLYISYQRPIIISTVELRSPRVDFINRSMEVPMPEIHSNDMASEREQRIEFERQKPDILGGLLDLTVEALKILPRIRLKQKTRMVDFDRWGVAVCQALGKSPNRFMERRFQQSEARKEKVSGGVTASELTPLSNALQTFMEGKYEWNGTATELFDSLEQFRGHKNQWWPSSAYGLGRVREKLNDNLNRHGIDIGIPRKKGNERIVTIVKLDKNAEDPRASDHFVDIEPELKCGVCKKQGGFWPIEPPYCEVLKRRIDEPADSIGCKHFESKENDSDISDLLSSL